MFHVCAVIRNRRSVLLLVWYEWFSRKGREWKIYRCGLAVWSEPQIWKFHVVLWQTLSKIAPKSVPHVQHDYFSSFNQSNHWFVALPLPSSFLKLLIYNRRKRINDKIFSKVIYRCAYIPPKFTDRCRRNYQWEWFQDASSYPFSNCPRFRLNKGLQKVWRVLSKITHLRHLRKISRNSNFHEWRTHRDFYRNWLNFLLN